MTTEEEILTNILIMSNQCINFLNILEISKEQILSEIKNNENDFFDKNPLLLSKINTLFNIKLLTSLTTNVATFMEEIKDIIDNCCKHKYIEDVIDVDYDRSIRVVYCQLCELTKK
jgi:hypothetical protein